MPPSPRAPAFRDLERALARRQLRRLGPRLGLELAAIAALAGAFCAWRVRVPLDGMARASGRWAALGWLAAGAALLLAAGAAIAGVRHRETLRARGGPPWLSLPIPPAEVAAHLARMSARWAWWTAVPAAAALIAGAGLTPAAALIALAALFFLLLPLAGRLGVSLALRIAARAAPAAARARHPFERLAWAVPAPRSRTAHRRSPFGRGPAWRAIVAKDLRLSLRPTPARRRLLLLLALIAASAVAWRLPGDPRLLHVVAFGLALMAAGALAEWLIQLAGSDPFSVIRALPVGVGALWSARFVLAAAVAALVTLGQLVAAPLLPPLALRVLLVWVAGATLTIGVLGAHYGLTLFPRTDHALRVLSITLGLTIAASLMIPLVGWILLLTAVIHSARRLPRWSQLEEA